jgi:hypothetical protein
MFDLYCARSLITTQQLGKATNVKAVIWLSVKLHISIASLRRGQVSSQALECHLSHNISPRGALDVENN